jgi:hypothetical protein
VLGSSYNEGQIPAGYQLSYIPTYPLVFKKNETLKELARESLVLCQFFHDNLWCFKVFEIIGTDGSLILKFSKELAPKRAFGIFTELEPKVL